MLLRLVQRFGEGFRTTQRGKGASVPPGRIEYPRTETWSTLKRIAVLSERLPVPSVPRPGAAAALAERPEWLPDEVDVLIRRVRAGRAGPGGAAGGVAAPPALDVLETVPGGVQRLPVRADEWADLDGRQLPLPSVRTDSQASADDTRGLKVDTLPVNRSVKPVGNTSTRPKA